MGLVLWTIPLVGAGARGVDSTPVFLEQGLFFSGAALVTFGGAYAVLAYVAQQAVEVYGWLAPGEMVRGLALAETTPGPFIVQLPSSAPTATPVRWTRGWRRCWPRC